MNIPDHLTISIASKDRAEVVEATLRQIHAFGLADCPLILCDDGSAPPLNPPALSRFPRGRLIRNEMAQGQAMARNRIAEECGTPYLLQLDDDSYPVAGTVESLLAFAEAERDWLAIAIPFEEPARGRSFGGRIPATGGLRVKAFVGCAVLLHVEAFRMCGGFAEWIGRTVEEEELCMRAQACGLRILAVDKVRVRHEVSVLNRNGSSIAYRAYRNWTLAWLLHAPALWVPHRLLRLTLGAFWHAVRHRELSALRGHIQAYAAFIPLRARRFPLSLAAYSEFQGLPHALELFGDNDAEVSFRKD